MRTHREHPPAGRNPLVSRDELAGAVDARAIAPAQGASDPAAAVLGLIAAVASNNRYTVYLADAAAPSQPPTATEATIEAANLAEPFDAPGQLAVGSPVLVWPAAGAYLFCQPLPGEGGGSGETAPSYWAKVLSGSGPSYTVRRQTPASATTFADADALDLSAANVWELSVDPDATAAVPVGAIVRVWEEPDTGNTTRRFFSYPIHAVYR